MPEEMKVSGTGLGGALERIQGVGHRHRLSAAEVPDKSHVLDQPVGVVTGRCPEEA